MNITIFIFNCFILFDINGLISVTLKHTENNITIVIKSKAKTYSFLKKMT